MLIALTLLDNKSNTYGKPLYFLTLKECKASLEQFFAHPEVAKDINPVDFDLFEIGTYDHNTGKHTSLEAPKHLYNCRTLKPQQPKETSA